MNRALRRFLQFLAICCLMVVVVLPAKAEDEASNMTGSDSEVRASVTSPKSERQGGLPQVPASKLSSAENATTAVPDSVSNVPRKTALGNVEEAGAGAIAVDIAHQGDDPVGKALALALKERLVRSPLFRLNNGDERKIILRLVTHPVFPDHPRLFSAYSLTWTLFEGPDTLSYFLRQDGGVLDSTQPEELASVLVGQTDKVAADAAYLFE